MINMIFLNVEVCGSFIGLLNGVEVSFFFGLLGGVGGIPMAYGNSWARDQT